MPKACASGLETQGLQGIKASDHAGVHAGILGALGALGAQKSACPRPTSRTIFMIDRSVEIFSGGKDLDLRGGGGGGGGCSLLFCLQYSGVVGVGF